MILYVVWVNVHVFFMFLMLQQVHGDADMKDGSFVEASTSDGDKPLTVTGMSVLLKAAHQLSSCFGLFFLMLYVNNFV